MSCEQHSLFPIFLLVFAVLIIAHLSQRYSVSVVQHLMLLQSLLPSFSAAQTESLLQPHEVELRYILRKQSLERVSRFMSPQMKLMLLNAARDVIAAFPKELEDVRFR